MTGERRVTWGLITGLLMGLGLAACLGPDDQNQLTPVNAPKVTGTAVDGGAQVANDGGGTGPTDAGEQDASVDAGMEAGTDAGMDAGLPTDAGTDAGTVTTISFPSSAGWTFYGPQNGGPKQVFGVTSDDAGDLWVAGGDDGLFVLEPGNDHFKRFTMADGLNGYTDATGPHGYPVISVSGGPGRTVYIGYHGVGDSDSDPIWMIKSGDADKVEFNGAGITATHFDISTPAGMYHTGNPDVDNGRDKIRNVFRILYDHKTGNVWFGGNHGVAEWDQKNQTLWEHQHAAINGYRLSAADDHSGTSYTLLSGDYYGIGLDGAGNFWFGGAHRISHLDAGNFWTDVTFDSMIDVWPDAVPQDARPEQRTDDFVQDLAVEQDGSMWVGSIPNGLAKVSSSGISYVDGNKMVDKKVTALELDPKDGSLWVGHIWGGVTRIKSGDFAHYDDKVFGMDAISGQVNDIQSDHVSGQRRILVGFSSGAIGIYTGD